MISSNFDKKIIDRDVYLIPKKQKHTQTLIFMHGYGDSPDGYMDVFYVDNPPVPKGTKIVLLCAPNKKGKNSWYDFEWGVHELGKGYNFDDVKENGERVFKVIENEVKELNNDYTKIFVGGFSQGGHMSLHVGFNFKEKIGGILCLSGALFPQSINKNNLTLREELNMFIGHGEKDNIIPFQFAQKSFLPIQNFPHFELKTYKSMAHSICNEELTDILDFLNKRIIEEPKKDL